MRTESTSGGTTMSDTDILHTVIGGKQRGHIPVVGPVLPGGGRQTTLNPARAREEASSSSLHETVQNQTQEMSQQRTILDMLVGWAKTQPSFPQELATLATTSGSHEATQGESRDTQEGSGASGASGGSGGSGGTQE